MGKFLTEEHATKLMNDLLDAFSFAFSLYPNYISKNIWHPKIDTKYRVHVIHAKESNFSIEDYHEKKKSLDIANIKSLHHIYRKTISCKAFEEESIETNSSYLIMRNRNFKFTVYDSPDGVGYNSVLPDYDPETYLCVNFFELREDNSTKYEITFGFDVEKMQFLELFDFTFTNKIGFCRVPQSIDELEKKFYGRKL